MKNIFIILITILLAAVLLFAGWQLYRHFSVERQVEKQFVELAGQIELPPAQETPDSAIEPEPPATEPTAPVWTVYDQYASLLKQNGDMVGWISIEDTTISHPVMHTPIRPDFYLKHDFDKKYSKYGVPYVDNNCSVDPQSDNLIIYGHHMKGGKMFGVLESYKKEAFYREHPTINFDTLTGGFGQYEIFAVFKVNPTDFKFHHFINAVDETAFDEYVNRCKALSFYNTGITPNHGDKLIALVTCEYSRDGNRLVVVAKKI